MSTNSTLSASPSKCEALFSLHNNTPKIMGVINLTKNSFNSIGKFHSVSAAVDYALSLITQGADIIDVGAEATNPGTAPQIDLAQELSMLRPFIKTLRKETNIPISVDTSKAQVMEMAVNEGANLINDVRALREENALTTAIKLKVPVCLMHMEYPHGLPTRPTPIGDIIQHVSNFLLARVKVCLELGMSAKQIILDPGIGGGSFGKSAKQSLQLIKNIKYFTQFGYPLLVGVSYKSYIGDVLNQSVEKRSAASLASAIYCMQHGANIIRVHEVEQTKQAFAILDCITKS
tara:strand:+ start:119 stop:988 length:870 start_codon:yes stop_codon:yes gene_type:complete